MAQFWGCNWAESEVGSPHPEATSGRPFADSSNIHLISSHAGRKLEHDRLLSLSDHEIDNIRGTNLKGKHPGKFEQHPDYKVFGWHLAGGTHYQSYNYSILWGLGFFDYNIDPATGNYSNPDAIRRWHTSAVIDSCKAHGTKVFLSVTNFTHARNKQFLENPTAQQTLIDSMISLLHAREADGISVDFEEIFTTRSVSGSDYEKENQALSEQLNVFFAKVKAAFDREGKGWAISIALPAADAASIFNLEKLLPSVDLFMIMGYDYWYAGSPTTGPVSPLRAHPGFGHLSLEQSVYYYLGKDENGNQVRNGIPPKRLVLALPYYGRSWGAESEQEHAKTTRQDHHAFTYSMVREKGYDEETLLDSFGYTKYKVLPDPAGGLSQVWFDDRETLTQKIGLIKAQGLAGMGIWALGDDNGYTDLWEMLVGEFGVDDGH